MLGIATALSIILLLLTYLYFTKIFNYWRIRGIVFIKPYPFVGSVWRLLALQEHMSEFFRRIYFDYTDEPYVGYYQGHTPSLLIRDPELIKNIIVKDFSYFNSHGFKFSEENDALMARNLFQAQGQRWKDLRTKLAPVFTSGRMKTMFPLVHQCAQNLETFVENIATSTGEIELKDLLARYTTNVIAACVFGIECDSLTHPNNTFRLMSRKLIETDFIQGIKLAIITFIPGMANVIKGTFFKPECEPYFRALFQDILHVRTTNSGKKRKDFMQMLIELNDTGRITEENQIVFENITNESKNLEKLTETDILAQALLFFFAGFDTSSSAMTFALFELARRPDLQSIARQSIEEVLQRHDGQVTYQALQEMTYLDWILQESLRKYPPIAIFRECVKKYTIPGTNVSIDKGTLVVIPSYGLHYDPQYFPDPEQFIPDRFSDDEMIKKNQYVYLPFGEGPRICIGQRFAYMQSKLGLLTMLRKFEIKQNPQMKLPLKWDPRTFLLTSKQGILIKIVKV